nr:ABC transporter substrate-binding protein [uncultured Oscillibacter sp.]
MKKKLLALVLTLAMALSLAACGGGDAPADSGDSGSDAPPAETQEPADSGDSGASGETYKVGICQLAPHPALDAATQGFTDALNALLPGQVDIDPQNAAGDSPTCATIVNGFVSGGVDLIMANATAPLQAAASATSDIPVLGTSVTEYGVALGIENFSGTVGSNVSGTSDLAPLDQQAEMIKEWYPDAKTVGLVFCSAEPNSQYQVDNVEKFLTDMGYDCTQYPFSDTNDMASVVQSAVDACDVLYVPTDNTVANNTGIVDNICRGVKPVFAGEEGICGGCGVATLSISYYDIGYKTGEMAADILTGKADVSAMAVEYAPQFTKKYNPVTCEALGLTAPEGYEAVTVQ